MSDDEEEVLSLSGPDDSGIAGSYAFAGVRQTSAASARELEPDRVALMTAAANQAAANVNTVEPAGAT
jgi:hypothetical protein